MSTVGRDFESSEIHPIDIVQELATERSWDFDRLDADQICMVITGTWGDYTITLAWSDRDETLRLVCAHTFTAPKKRHGNIHTVLGLANDKCWSGAFVLWSDQRMLGYRYSLNLTGGAQASSAQINSMVSNAVLAFERFYPAFQLVAGGDQQPEAALGVAMHQAFGRA